MAARWWSSGPGAARCSPGRPRSVGRSPGSVLVLDVEIGTADRSGELGLLPGELELRRQLLGDVHPCRELEPHGPLRLTVDGVHDVDRQAALVEDVGDADALDLEPGRLEGSRADDDVTLFLQDAMDPVDGRLG